MIYETKVASQVDFSNVSEEIRKKFSKYCESHEWTPVFRFYAHEVEISFVSPQPEVEHIVRGLNLSMAMERALV